MYVVVRQYEGASALADVMADEAAAADVKEVLSGVQGFVAYYAAREGDSVTTVSICQDRAGAEETTKQAGALVQKYLPGTTMSPPRVGTGEVILNF